MVAASALASTEEVLAGLRDELAALVPELTTGSVGIDREDALDLAERVEEIAREVSALQVVAARAVDLAAPAPVTTGLLVDHGDGGAREAEPTPCESLVAPRDDGRSPFARARDLLRVRLRISGREASSRLRRAAHLCERVTTSGEILPPRRSHLAAAVGHLDPEAESEVMRVLERVEALPAVTSAEVDRLEQTLTEQACSFDVDQLRKIGRHAVAVMDPDGAEPDESLARSRQGVHIGRLYNGLATVRLVVNAVQLEVLQTAFDAGTNPRTSIQPLLDRLGLGDAARDDDAGPTSVEVPAPVQAGVEEAGTCLPTVTAGAGNSPAAPSEGEPPVSPKFDGAAATLPEPQDVPGVTDSRTRPQRQLDALIAATAAAIRGDVLPQTGGTPTQVIVTMSATDLAGPADTVAPGDHSPPSNGTGARSSPLDSGRGVVDLPHAGPVPIAMVKHLACDATLTPVLLGKHRRVLSLGQRVRLFPGWMRRALLARDGNRCAFPGCQIPGAWCEAHHIVAWYRGGETSVENGVLLCPHHHQQCDRGIWAVRQARPGATPTFHPTL